jgi:hypothetical protein
MDRLEQMAKPKKTIDDADFEMSELELMKKDPKLAEVVHKKEFASEYISGIYQLDEPEAINFFISNIEAQQFVKDKIQAFKV